MQKELYEVLVQKVWGEGSMSTLGLIKAWQALKFAIVVSKTFAEGEETL